MRGNWCVFVTVIDYFLGLSLYCCDTCDSYTNINYDQPRPKVNARTAFWRGAKVGDPQERRDSAEGRQVPRLDGTVQEEHLSGRQNHLDLLVG